MSETAYRTSQREWDLPRIVTAAVAAALAGPAIYLMGRAAPAVSTPPMADTVAYSGGMAPGWQDWSWGEREIQSRGRLFDGKPSIRFAPAEFKGIYLHTDGLETRDLSSISLWVNGGFAGGQRVVVCTVDSSNRFGPKVDLGSLCNTGAIPSGRWTRATAPIRTLAAGGRITGIVIQDSLGKRQPSIYLAEISFRGGGQRPASNAVSIMIDLTKGSRAISPLIYGLAGGSAEMLRELRTPIVRWGGNPNTRYNWERGNCWNAARDWEFRNGNYGHTSLDDRAPSGVADQTIRRNRSLGASTLLTIPTIGYVARDDSNGTRSVGVPKDGANGLEGAAGGIAGYDPAANRVAASIPSFARKRGPFRDPPNLADNAVYQDEWVSHLVHRFGRAADGGVRFYAMDNEPDLWASTHTDIHPARMGYDDLAANFLEYATAVKDVDRSAEVTGPVSWGWTGYMHSPRDAGNWTARPDRRAHGDLPFIPWFLQTVRKRDLASGRRTLDVLDIHYYPQGAGVYAGGTDAATNALRLRSTRSLYDQVYRDESWIGEPVELIPRMRSWIDRYYPGTKLGITEWNWGADGTVNGALAIAECLGIFGRQGVDLANYWTAPHEHSPGAYAFKLYRNADDAGSGFGDRSVSAECDRPDDVSCFASIDTRSNAAVAVFINKEPHRTEMANVRIAGGGRFASASLYRFDGSSPAGIAHLPESRAAGSGTFRLSLPPYSITLARFH